MSATAEQRERVRAWLRRVEPLIVDVVADALADRESQGRTIDDRRLYHLAAQLLASCGYTIANAPDAPEKAGFV